MHRRTTSLGDDRRRCEQATAESGIQSEGFASRQSEVGVGWTRIRRRVGACPVSLRGRRRGKPPFYGKSHVELAFTRMATSTTPHPQSAPTSHKPPPIPPLFPYL